MSITVCDVGLSVRFYDAVLATLGVARVGKDLAGGWAGYGERRSALDPDRSDLSIRTGRRPEDASGRHWCFKAADRAAVGTTERRD